MTDTELADELIARLNTLIIDPEVRTDIQILMTRSVDCSGTTSEHPTLQVMGDPPTLRILGLLNGIVGTIPDGKFKGWGWIAAEFDDDNQLMRFIRTDHPIT